MLLEVLEHLHDAPVVVFHGVHILVRVHCCPHQVVPLTESSVRELRILVDYKVIISTNSKESSSRSKFNALRKGLRVAQVFDNGLELLAILHFLLNQLQVHCLDLALFHPHQLPIVKTHHWELLSDFNYHCCFVKAKSHVIAFRKCMNSPDPLQAIIESGLMFEGNRVPDIDDIILSS